MIAQYYANACPTPKQGQGQVAFGHDKNSAVPGVWVCSLSHLSQRNRGAVDSKHARTSHTHAQYPHTHAQHTHPHLDTEWRAGVAEMIPLFLCDRPSWFIYTPLPTRKLSTPTHPHPRTHATTHTCITHITHSHHTHMHRTHTHTVAQHTHA